MVSENVSNHKNHSTEPTSKKGTKKTSHVGVLIFFYANQSVHLHTLSTVYLLGTSPQPRHKGAGRNTREADSLKLTLSNVILMLHMFTGKQNTTGFNDSMVSITI